MTLPSSFQIGWKIVSPTLYFSVGRYSRACALLALTDLCSAVFSA